MELCHKSQRRLCSKKEEDISVVKNRERGGTRVFEGLVKEGIHLTIKIIIDIISVLCAEEGWKEEDYVKL